MCDSDRINFWLQAFTSEILYPEEYDDEPEPRSEHEELMRKLDREYYSREDVEDMDVVPTEEVNPTETSDISDIPF